MVPFSTWSLRILAGWIHIQGDEPCRQDKPYKDKKHSPKTCDKVQQTIKKDCSWKQHRSRIPFEKKRRIEYLRYGKLPPDSVLFYEDEEE